MRKFFSLLKVQMNAQWGLSLARYSMKNDKKALLKGIGIALAMLLAIGQFVFMYSFLVSKVYEAAKVLKAQQLIITTGAMGAGMFTLFFGIFFILGALFLAKDTEMLSALPLRQESVFISKFIIVLLGEYPFVLFFMIPPVVIYGVGEGKGIFYYLTALLCMLLLPLIPLVISSLLSLGLMRLVSQSRRRDLITIIGSTVLLIGLFVGQFTLFSKIPENDPDFLVRLLQNSDGLVEFSGRMFPPSIWITRALSLSGVEAVKNFLYVLLLSLAALLLVYGIASRIYQRGATAQLETIKRTTGKRLEYKVASPVMATFKNEWRNLLRTPVFALNSLVVVFIGPLIMSMPLFGGNFAKDPDIQALYSIIYKYETSAYLPFVIAAILTLMSMMNPAISSTFSREGKAFWILKNIPVKPIKQVMGKLVAGYSMSFMASIATGVIVSFAFKISIGVIITSILISILALVSICVLGILIDLMRPKLKWGNPQEAIKQNLNVMLQMVAGFAFILVFGFLAFMLFTSGINASVVSAILIILLVLSGGASVFLLFKTSDRFFSRIEA